MSFVNRFFCCFVRKRKITSTCMCWDLLLQTMTSASGRLTCYLCNLRDDRDFHVQNDHINQLWPLSTPQAVRDNYDISDADCMWRCLCVFQTVWETAARKETQHTDKQTVGDYAKLVTILWVTEVFAHSQETCLDAHEQKHTVNTHIQVMPSH